jgi:metal-responsive CopG/Arc/MetJ family transcriptional regulator
MESIKRRRRGVAATVTRQSALKKVVADFPAPLFREAERAAHELSMNRSCFIRTAVETFLRNREKEKLEKTIAESFLANAELDRRLVDEFKYADADEPPNL